MKNMYQTPKRNKVSSKNDSGIELTPDNRALKPKSLNNSDKGVYNSGSPSLADKSVLSPSETRRGRPRADLLNTLILEGSTSPSSIKCKYCRRVFPREKSLQAHLRTHTGKLEELAPKKAVKCAAICNACSKSFVKYSNLIQHMKTFYKNIQDQLTEPEEYTYKCDKCQKQFSHPRHLKSHMKSHQEHNSSGLKCILCKNSSESDHFQKSNLFEHFQQRHDINVVTEMFHVH